eukprot:GHVT01081346.1.p1 GENE.GHVT01081346.1~~GHVT01081346.1.p1  ORF type:complete len:170 (-),score=27.32 GHVT01081346.1:2889-3344(-)
MRGQMSSRPSIPHSFFRSTAEPRGVPPGTPQQQTSDILQLRLSTSQGAANHVGSRPTNLPGAVSGARTSSVYSPSASAWAKEREPPNPAPGTAAKAKTETADRLPCFASFNRVSGPSELTQAQVGKSNRNLGKQDGLYKRTEAPPLSSRAR